MLDELQRRNYSSETTRGYVLAIKQFAEYFHKSPEQLGGDEIRQFELYLLKEKTLAPGTVEGRMSALRLLLRSAEVNHIEELRRQGLSLCAIAAQTGFDRKMIRKYLANPAEQPRYGP